MVTGTTGKTAHFPLLLCIVLHSTAYYFVHYSVFYSAHYSAYYSAYYSVYHCAYYSVHYSAISVTLHLYSAYYSVYYCASMILCMHLLCTGGSTRVFK